MARILIMDDSMMMRSVLRNFLRKLGHDSVESKNGDEVVELFKSEKPDVVFMDIIVPGGTDGWEATKRIKAIDPNAKIVMVTSLKEKEDEDNAKKLGAVGYVRKPFSMEEIKTTLANLGYM
ncbi:response regulator [Candidatus Woesearchaeota archaeon]|nr:response regulator [Candidatus Woesearchaeota archaeon]